MPSKNVQQFDTDSLLTAVFSRCHIEMRELNQKGCVLKNWCFWIVVLEKTLRGSLAYKGIKPVNPKGNQLWVFTGKAVAEVPMLWPPDAKNDSLEKTPVLRKVEGKRRRRRQKMKWWDNITDSIDTDLSKLWEIVEDSGTWCGAVTVSQRVRHDHNWTTRM